MRSETPVEMTAHGHTVDRLAEEDQSKISTRIIVVQLPCTALLVSRQLSDFPIRAGTPSSFILGLEVDALA